MTHEPETLTQLVAQRVGDGGDLMTYRAFEAAALDPKEGYRPSRSTIWKIRNGEPIKVSPEVVRAVAAGLHLDLIRVQAAAAYQYTGLVAVRSGSGFVVRPPGVEPGPRAKELLDQWDAEESGGNHTADS